MVPICRSSLVRPISVRAPSRPPSLALGPLAVAIASALAAWTPDATAQACSFVPAAGSWNLAANWSCGNVPTAANTISIGGGSSVTLPAGSLIAVFANGMTNDGSVALGLNTDFVLSGGSSATFAGTGAVTLTGATARLYSQSGGGVLTNGVGHTIEGSGQLGVGLTGLNNLGTITANQAGATLTVDLSDTVGVTRSNAGSMRAENGGTLAISATDLAQTASGTIEARNASTVNLTGNTLITGGTLATQGTGQLVLGGNATLTGVTNTGQLVVASGQTGRITGTVTNNGSFSVGGNTDLLLSGSSNATLAGTGNLTMTAATARLFSQSGGGTLTNAAGHTIQGQGQIGANLTSIVNAGTIVANAAGQTLTLDPASSVSNAGGTLRAAGGGTLSLGNGTYSGGTIDAQVGSIVLLNSTVTVSGATFTGAGVHRNATSASNALSDVNVAAGATYNIIGNTTTTVSGTITNDGTILLSTAPAQGNAQMNVSGAVTLAGSGTLRLSDNSANNNFITGTGTLTNTAGHTIEGGGGGISGGLTSLVNDGTIRSTSTAGGTRLFLNPGAGSTITNNGTFASLPGGHLEVSGARLTNLAGNTLTGGTYVVGDQGSATQSILRITGANIVTNAANIQLDGAGASFSNSASPINIAAGDRTAMANLATNTAAGAITVRNGANFTTAGALNNAGTLTSGPGASTWTNTGVLTNSGTIHAAGGTINAVAGLAGATGTAIVSGAGTLQIGAASTTGTLTHNGTAGSALALGANNITVASDYTNANFGVGNAFAARANVTGTGQIIGQNASSAITGQASATGANTYTVDLGTVRGGTTATRDIQIANTGTGASIRGAIQTTGVTDTRIGGTAVQPGGSNFGPIAAGGSSGNLSVSFNASSGGSLVGQSLQVVSNFSNVATQTIALAGQATSLAQGNATPNASPVSLGSFRVGGTAPAQDFAVQNTTAASALTERLGVGSVSTTGNFAATNLLGSGLVNGGATAAGAVRASVAGGVAGVNTGSLTLNYTTEGTQIAPGFAAIAANSQTVGLTATGYNVATGSAAPSPNVNFGNLRVGQSASQALTITNTAAPGAFTEALNASFGAPSGPGGVTATGSISGGLGSGGLGGGQSNATAMVVALDTSTSGARGAGVGISFQSNGAGTSGLGTIASNSQVINVSGNVYQVAAGTLNVPTSLNFGTVQVGQLVSQNLSITNSATGAAGFVEDLNVRFGTTSGAGASQILGAGQITGLAAGATNAGGSGAGGMTVSVNTGTAGTINGSIAVGFYSAGTVGGVSNGLGELAVGSTPFGVAGVIEATGNVINQASPVVNTAQPIALGNVRVGDVSPSATVSVTNQATAAPQAALNASIAGNGPISGSGAFSLLAPGGTNAGALQVGMNTATAGARNGTATISFVSDASNVGGCAPNCQLALASQDVAVTGGVYQAAQASVPASVNLGSVRVGTSASGTVAIGNTLAANVPAGFQEGLRATVSGTTAGASASGTLANVAAGTSANLAVSQTAAAAGINTGTVSLALASTGAGTSGLADLNQGSATVNVQATGYRTANGAGNSVVAAGVPSVLAARVGDAAPTAVVNVTNTSPDAFTERLDVTGVSGASGPFAGSLTAAATGIAAQATAGAVGITMSTATAGSFAGSITLDYASSGAGTTGAADLAVGSGSVALAGRVYTPATVQLAQSSIDFGIVHVGDVLTDVFVGLGNGAADTALNDLLVGTMSVTGAGFDGGGNLGAGLDAGQVSGGLLSVGLDTTASGQFAGQAQFALASRNPDLADLSLSAGPILLFGQVNQFASAGFGGAGIVQTGANSYLLDLGTVTLGSAGTAATLFALNDAVGLADLLAGNFALGDGASAGLDFAYTGFGTFSGLGAGGQSGALGIAFSQTDTVGTFDDLIVLSGVGSNASGFSQGVADVTLLVRVDVVQGGQVPIPSSALLLGLGLLAMAGLGRGRGRQALPQRRVGR